MSVVPGDFEELKRYNLAEIFEPSPKEQPKKAAPKEIKEPAEEGTEAKTVSDKVEETSSASDVKEAKEVTEKDAAQEKVDATEAAKDEVKQQPEEVPQKSTEQEAPADVVEEKAK